MPRSILSVWRLLFFVGRFLFPKQNLTLALSHLINLSIIISATDFIEMLKKNTSLGYNEIGLGIDHYSALVLDGEKINSISIYEEKKGSVLNEVDMISKYEEREGDTKPGIWRMSVNEDGEMESLLMPSEGEIFSKFLNFTFSGEEGEIIDEDVVRCINENPIEDGV